MTPEMRRKHLQKVHGATLAYDARASPALTPCEQQCGTSSSDGKRWKSSDVTERTTSIVCNSPSCHSEESDRSALSIEVIIFAHTVKTPEPVLQGIWKEAAKLVTNPCKMSLAPGCSPLARMVESTSGNKPHLISPGKGGKFTCDSECPNYKSFANMFSCNCSCRSQLHAWRVHKPIPEVKKVPKLSALAKTGLPKGRGRKGGEPARKRRKLPTPATRVPLNPTSSHSEDPCSFSNHGSITQPQAQVSLSSPPPMLPSAPPPCGLPPLHIPCHSPQSVPPFASPGPPPPLQFQSSPLPHVPAHNVTTLINSGNASTHVVVPQCDAGFPNGIPIWKAIQLALHNWEHSKMYRLQRKVCEASCASLQFMHSARGMETNHFWQFSCSIVCFLQCILAPKPSLPVCQLARL